MSAPDRKIPTLTSAGFLRSLFGILVTTLAWFGPWSWPAWPAMVVLAVAFSPTRPFAALTYGERSTVVVALIVVNVASWAVFAWGVGRLRTFLTKRA